MTNSEAKAAFIDAVIEMYRSKDSYAQRAAVDAIRDPSEQNRKYAERAVLIADTRKAMAEELWPLVHKFWPLDGGGAK